MCVMNKILLIVLLLSGCAVTQQELDPVKTAAAIGQAHQQIRVLVDAHNKLEERVTKLEKKY